MGGNGAFAQDHFLRVDVVVDGVEGADCGQAAALQQNLRHELPVLPGKALADLHVVQIVLQVLPVDEAEILGDRGLPVLPLELLEGFLDLGASAGCLVLRDQRVAFGKVFLLALVQVDGKILVVVCHLKAQVP